MKFCIGDTIEKIDRIESGLHGNRIVYKLDIYEITVGPVAQSV